VKTLIVKQTNEQDVANATYEHVSNASLYKLYHIIQKSFTSSDFNCILKGSVEIQNIYEHMLRFFNESYQDFHILHTGEYYIDFEDKKAEKMCANVFGDTIGITEGTAKYFNSTTSTISETVLKNYPDIEYLNEWRYFKNFTSFPNYLFREYKTLKEIDLSNAVIIGEQTFKNAIALENIGDTSNITTLKNHAFLGSGLTSVDFQNLISIGNYVFEAMPNLQSAHVNLFSEGLFYNSKKLETVLGMNDLTSIPRRLFYGCNKLFTTDIDWNKITTVNYEAFSNCNEYVFPDDLGKNITTLGYDLFVNCYELRHYDATNLVSAGYNCFGGCKNLVGTVDLSNLTSSISGLRGFFYNCNSLEHVILPEDQLNYTLDGSFFRYCNSLIDVNLDKCGRINNECFLQCYALTNIGNTEHLTYIGYNAFNSCTNLDHINLSNVTTLDHTVFYRCKNLKSVSDDGHVPLITTINGSTFREVGTSGEQGLGELTFDLVTTVGGMAFYGSYGITKLNFPELLSTTGNENFHCCYDLVEVVSPKLNKINDTWVFADCPKLESVDITHITDAKGCLLYRCPKIKSISPTNTCEAEYIRGSAFREMGSSGAQGVGEISFPNCILVEGEAFKDSYGITKINFGNLQEIKYDAFCRCKDLEYITGLDNVTICRQDVFWECPKLKEISLPNVEQFIDGGSQFYRCKGLISVNLPKLTKFGGNQTFRECRIEGLLNLPLLEDPWGQETFSGAKIKKINLHSCTKLYQWQFDGNDLLEEIDLTLCESFTGRNIFCNCSSLKTIELPSFSGDVPYYCFRNCNALTSITFGDNNIRLTNECINYCGALKTINLNKCIYIGDYALCENTKLESIGTLSNELTYIGREAFRNDTMLSGNITIPASVQTIGYRAFWNCGSITSITMLATTPPQMNGESFNGTLSYPIYVPAGSVDTYKAASSWSNIASRIFAAP